MCSIMILISCGPWKDLNNVPLCSEPGLFIDLNKKGDYRINGSDTFEGKKVTRKMADSTCLAIKSRN